jgi:hypothetical protein
VVDVLPHLRLQLAAASLMSFVMALVVSCCKTLALSLVLTIVNVIPLMPYLAGSRADESKG